MPSRNGVFARMRKRTLEYGNLIRHSQSSCHLPKRGRFIPTFPPFFWKVDFAKQKTDEVAVR